jgi:hypothetical protein
MPLPDEQQQIEAIGEQLRAKIASKFTASTARHWTFWWALAGLVLATAYYKRLRTEAKAFNPLVRPVD